jgi:site-specific DNA recombinase
MTSAVIYARFSSELQRDQSIEDQIEVCRREIERQGWTVAKVYADRALSGASRFRPQYQQMMADAELKQFDILVCEALDRLGRKLADIADLHDRLSFRGIKIHTVATGAVTQLHIGMLGTMAQLYLSDLREKVWRGQLGRARQGRIPGGVAYGYDVVAERDASGGGRRIINDAEAAIVRRIFQDYAAGLGPRNIAKRLNEEHVPGPAGREWRDTTIRGQVDRGTGLLNNTLYIGRLEWNRTAYVKNPQTGKKVARVNKQDAREIVEVPELRIIGDDLWQKVKARQQEARIEMGKDRSGNVLNHAHRRKFLLSELLVCGVCGGGYTITGKDRYGCATRRAKGTCGNDKTITRQRIESRVLGGLKEKLMAPELVAEFIRTFQEEMNAATKTAAVHGEELKREAEAVERKMAGIMAAIEDGMYTPVLKERMKALETRKAEIQAIVAGAEAPSVIRLRPNAAEVYRRKVAELELALNDDSIKAEAAEILRSLIDRIVLTPVAGASDGIDAQLHGDLAAVLALGDESPDKQKLPAVGMAGSQLSVVAVESGCGAVALGTNISVPASFVWRCLTGPTMAPFPHPAHRTGHADLPHPALGQDLTLSSTARHAQAGSGVRARSARTGARVDSSRPCAAA